MKLLKLVLLSSLCVAVGILPAACSDSSTAPGVVGSHYTISKPGGTGFSITGLNDAGQVVGSYPDGTVPRNFLIDHDVKTDLGSCVPTAVNDVGLVACGGGTLWQNGTITTLPFPPNTLVYWSGVNDRGVGAGTVGYAYSPGVTPPCPAVRCAFITVSGKVILITPPPPRGDVFVPNITSGTDVVLFEISDSNPPEIAVWNIDSTSTPYACAGLPANSNLYAVGGDHELIGVAVPTDVPGNANGIVCRDGVMQLLGPQTNRTRSISRNGLIVGTTDDGHGFFWNNGKLTNLDKLVAWTDARVTNAYLVNNAGQIVVTASDGETLLLTPK